MNQKIRLDRLLSNRGYASRKEVKSLLKENRVTVADHAADSVEQKVSPDEVRFDGEVLDPGRLTIMLHKPLDYTCTHDSSDSIFSLLPERYARRNPLLSCAGRLDKDASGLVILSDDGQLVHRIISPRSKIPKIYRVRVSQALLPQNVDMLASGELRLKGEQDNLLPAQLKIIGDHEGELCIVEGRYHQVKRMFAAMGNHVEELQRIQIGGLTLGTLQSGAHRLLSEQEVNAIGLPIRSALAPRT